MNWLILGRGGLWIRRHSSMGARTAASTPRRVITWGPFFSAASRNSLNRGFASFNCHELTIGLFEANDITSQMTSQHGSPATSVATTDNLPAPWPHDPAQRPELTTAVAPDPRRLCRWPHSLLESRPRRSPYIPPGRKLHAETTDGAAILRAQAELARRPAAPGSSWPDLAVDH